MLTQAVAATAQLLVFRSGPQDFPYSTTPGLGRHCLLFAVVAVALPAALADGLLAGLASGAMIVAGLAVFTRLLLRLRQLPNRFQQTFNSLLCVSGALCLLALPAWLAILPAMQAVAAKLAADPTIGQSPERMAALQSELQAGMPSWAVMLIFALSLWQFVVSARLFSKATDTGSLAGVGMALLCQLNLAAFFVVAASLAQLVAG